MSLREKQSEFARMVPRLIDKAHELGFEVTLGDAYRPAQCKIREQVKPPLYAPGYRSEPVP